jgi:hypothetical protein
LTRIQYNRESEENLKNIRKKWENSEKCRQNKEKQQVRENRKIQKNRGTS